MTLVKCLIHNVTWGAAEFPDGKPEGWFEECPVCLRERNERLYNERNTLLAERGTLISAMRIIRTNVEVAP